MVLKLCAKIGNKVIQNTFIATGKTPPLTKTGESLSNFRPYQLSKKLLLLLQKLHFAAAFFCLYICQVSAGRQVGNV